MSNELDVPQSSPRPQLTTGQFFHPGTQNSLLWRCRDAFLDGLANGTPEVFDTLRSQVLPQYRPLGARVAHFYARTHEPRRFLDWSDFVKSVPRFLFETALGLVDRSGRIEFWYPAIRSYLEGYPESEPPEVFLDEGVAQENTLSTTLLFYEPEARQQEYVLFLEGLLRHVSKRTIVAFAKEAHVRLQQSEHALQAWAVQHNLDVEWVLQNVRETLFCGAFAESPHRFPNVGRWETTLRDWSVAEKVEQSFPQVQDIRVPFDYRPLVESRDEFEQRALAAFHAARKKAVDELEGHLARAGYLEGTQMKLQAHHYEWLAMARVRNATADEVLNDWSHRHQEESPSTSTVTRGIKSAAATVGIDPLIRKGRREKKQD